MHATRRIRKLTCRIISTLPLSGSIGRFIIGAFLLPCPGSGWLVLLGFHFARQKVCDIVEC